MFQGSVGVFGVGGSGAAVAMVMCCVCGRMFRGRNRHQNLSTHMRIHTGETPFPCPHCPYRAKRKAHLQMHLERIHSPRVSAATAAAASCVSTNVWRNSNPSLVPQLPPPPPTHLPLTLPLPAPSASPPLLPNPSSQQSPPPHCTSPPSQKP